MNFRAGISAVIAIVLLGFIAGTGHAATSFAFGKAHKRIAAGVLGGWVNTGSASGPIAQGTFAVMNQRLDVKPAGWDFYNPLAANSSPPLNSPAWWTPQDTPGYLASGFDKEKLCGYRAVQCIDPPPG